MCPARSNASMSTCRRKHNSHNISCRFTLPHAVEPSETNTTISGREGRGGGSGIFFKKGGRGESNHLLGQFVSELKKRGGAEPKITHDFRARSNSQSSDKFRTKWQCVRSNMLFVRTWVKDMATKCPVNLKALLRALRLH